MLAVAIVILAVVATSHSEFYLTERNFSLVLPLLAILAVAALGQQMVMMIGGIDLSIGPLMGLVVVVASFQLTPDQTAARALVRVGPGDRDRGRGRLHQLVPGDGR